MDAPPDPQSSVAERTRLLDGPLADLHESARVLDSTVVFTGKVWDVRRDRFRFGDGEIVREYVDHSGAVAILAMDADGRILVINQYRHPVRLRDWELPAGLLDVPGEDPLDAAKRELAEEADLVAGDWSELVTFHTSPGGSDELVTVYLARDVRPAADVFERGEEEAQLIVRWVPLSQVVEAALEGRLRNAILMLAALAAHARR